MFAAFPRLRSVYRPHSFHRWHRLGDFSSACRGFGCYSRRWPRAVSRKPRREPLAALILLAGLAAFAYAWLATAAHRPTRTKAEKIMLGLGIAAVGMLLLSLRRSAARYRR